jgi:nitrite reductase (NADH) large subunit
MRHLIIGNSAAGIFAAEAIRRVMPEAEITMLSDEPYGAYSRCLITYYLAGDREEKHLAIRDSDFYDRTGINLRLGEKVIGVNPSARTVTTITERVYHYDRLLVASGASPEAPFIPGADCRAVFAGLRTLNDAKSMQRYVAPGKKAVIIGAGQVSLKTAYGLCRRGMDVTVISSSPQIFSQALDETAAAMVEARLAAHGIRFLKNSDVEEVGSRGPSVCMVRTCDGKELEADLVVIGKGVRPNTGFLSQSGVALERGVLTDEYQQTNMPDIYAAGDVVESYDRAMQCRRVNAIWPNATEQGRIAGLNMAGTPTRYHGSLAMNSAELFGFNVIAGGMGRGSEPEYEVTRNTDYLGNYRRLVWEGDILRGFILAGDTRNAGVLTALVREGRPLGRHKDKLCAGRASYAMFNLYKERE